MKTAKSLPPVTSPEPVNDVHPALALDDGSVASLVDGGLELRDREGRLLIRWRDGAAEISAPSGDLVLGSATGRVVIRAPQEVAIESRSIALSATKYELVATRLVEKTRDAFRDVADLAQTRVGRARTLVES